MPGSIDVSRRPDGNAARSSVSAKKRKSRGKGLRVRTGCAACKSRHAKCDEQRPVCKACQKAERECHYSALAESATGDLPSGSDSALGASIVDNATPVHESLGSLASEQIEQPGRLQITTGSQPQVGFLDVPSVNSIAAATPNNEELTEAALFRTSPDSTWSGWADVTAETASLNWFDLLATDVSFGSSAFPETPSGAGVRGFLEPTGLGTEDAFSTNGGIEEGGYYTSCDDFSLTHDETRLFEHFVLYLSKWIDVTDPQRSFGIIVPQMALKNRGLMTAILATAARHMSLPQTSVLLSESDKQSHKTMAIELYHETLRYLQSEMKKSSFLRSDELLATVLTVSTFEMIDGSGRGWERHLKGVFWIQRSQLIHGESQGLKQRIWWAWLRQDIWVAYKERRKILSYYRVQRPCSTLDVWELVDRALWLLGQCVNYASSKEELAGHADVQMRLERSVELWAKLTEWNECFRPHDRRLPAFSSESSAFDPIWVNPPAVALAVQVHYFSRLLLYEHTPAIGGMKEMNSRMAGVNHAINTVCGIAHCVTDDSVSILSSMCVFGAGTLVNDRGKRDDIVKLLQAHRQRTGWPSEDMSEELERRWRSSDDG